MRKDETLACQEKGMQKTARVQPAVNSWALLCLPRWEDQAPSNSVPTPPRLPAASPGLQEVLSSSQPLTYSVTPGNLL